MAIRVLLYNFVFFFNDTATTEIYTLSLHDALPIYFKRIDDENGMEYRSGQKVVTEFPEELQVSFIMFDIPCKSQTLEPGPRKYLTQEMIDRKSTRLNSSH